MHWAYVSLHLSGDALGVRLSIFIFLVMHWAYVSLHLSGDALGVRLSSSLW